MKLYHGPDTQLRLYNLACLEALHQYGRIEQKQEADFCINTNNTSRSYFSLQ